MKTLSSFNDEQDNEDLRCSKCLYYFSSITKPYLLPCNKHNLCMNCIEDLIKEKKTFCPICKIQFNKKDKENFKVNIAFLNLISKILKTKIILCQKCNKIYYWKDHFDKCDQKNFTEVNKIILEIKKLFEECLSIINNKKHYNDILLLSKSSINDSIEYYFNKINQKFKNNYSLFINYLFSNVKKINIENSKKEIINFLEMIKQNNKLFTNINKEELENLLPKKIKNLKNNQTLNSIILKNQNLKKSKSPFPNNKIYLNSNINFFKNESYESDETDIADEGLIQNLKIRQIKLNKNIEYNLPIFDIDKNKKNIFDIKEILDDINLEKPKNKIIVGLNGIKIISSNLENKNKRNNIREINDNINHIFSERRNRNLEVIKKNNILKMEKERNNLNNSDILNNNKNNELKIMNKIIKNFNKIRDISNQMKEYLNEYNDKNNLILNQINKNSLILNPKIISNYNLLLNEITYNYPQSYKKNIINYYENSSKISLLEIQSNKIINKDIKEIIKNIILDESISIVYDDFDLLFITGGRDENNLPLNLFYCIKWSKFKIQFIEKMPLKRYFHSSIYFNNKLYIIGGKDENNNLISECLLFNLIENKWEKIPNLNNPRIKPSLCIYNNNYLYVITGKNNLDTINTIEFININSLNNWILFKPKDPGFCFFGFETSCSITLDKNKILIFGGRDFKGNLNNSSFILNIENHIIYKSKDISFSSNFIFEPLIFQNSVFAIDWKNQLKTKDGNFIHIYDIKNKKWFYESI